MFRLSTLVQRQVGASAASRATSLYARAAFSTSSASSSLSSLLSAKPSKASSSSSSIAAAQSQAQVPTMKLSTSATAAAANSETVSCFPGAKGAPYTTKLELVPPHPVLPVFRRLDNHGKIIDPSYTPTLDVPTLVKIYRSMIQLSTMDQIFYDAQRQGRISFYMTSTGEEATHFGSAAALDPEDIIYAQYREAGVLMWRGFSLESFAHQCFSTHKDLGKGRQMPVHYGSRALNFHTISSPLATQIPQAAGAAYALRREGKGKIVMCYFGEGAASEGDFHPALNFAAVLNCPVVFFCRNNGYAISTSVSDQYKGDGIAARASGYGMDCIRVDGNDLLAVYDATVLARERAARDNVPVLVEAMSYRGGHHSTSDDSTRYRSPDEIALWNETNNPSVRLRMFLESKNAWDEVHEAEARQKARQDTLKAMNEAETARKPPVSQLFEDVYDKLPHHLQDQKREWSEHLAKHGGRYHLGEYLDDKDYQDPGKQH